MADQRPRAGLYHRGNPPPSIEEAQGRLQLVETTISTIESRIEFSNPEDFKGSMSFADWQARSTKALGHFRAERSFLERWLLADANLQRNGRAPDARTLSIAGGGIRLEVSREVIYLNARYVKRYKAEMPPPDFESAQKRHADISPLYYHAQAKFVVLKEQARKAGIGKDTLKKLEEPLTSIAEQIKNEMRIVNDVIRAHTTGTVPFLLELLDRALAAGMKISDDERGRLEFIKVKNTPREQAAAKG